MKVLKAEVNLRLEDDGQIYILFPTEQGTAVLSIAALPGMPSSIFKKQIMNWVEDAKIAARAAEKGGA